MPFGGIGFDEYGEPIKSGGTTIVPPISSGGGGGGGGGGIGGYSPPAMSAASALQGFVSPDGIPITVRKRGMPKIPGVTPGRPTKNDTVPAMLTPGEIVMNPGVTSNPQLAALLLAINQRGARNMQTGLGPVGMEYGGQIGFAYGGEVPGFGFGGWLKGIGKGIGKAGSWLKHNATLKNYGKYVLGNAALAGTILGAPVIGSALGIGGAAGAGGAGAAGAGAAGAGAGAAGAGAAGAGAAGGGLSGFMAAHPTLTKIASGALQGGGSSGGEQSAPSSFTPSGFQYSGVQQQPIGGGYAYGGEVPGYGLGGFIKRTVGSSAKKDEKGEWQGGSGITGFASRHPGYTKLAAALMSNSMPSSPMASFTPTGFQYSGISPMQSIGQGYAEGGMVSGEEDAMDQGQHMMPDGTMMPGQEHGGEMPESGEDEMQAQGGEGHENPYPSSAVRILQLLLELDEAEQSEYGPQGMASTGMAFGGVVPMHGYAGRGFPYHRAQGAGLGGIFRRTGSWLKGRFKSPSKPKIDPYGYGQQQQGDIAAARQAGYFDPRGNQALLRSQLEGAQGTADALVRRQMTQANLGGLDPAQRAVAKQQALLGTGRGVQDIMAQTRANVMGAQDQFLKSMYGGAASMAQQAQTQNALQKNQPGQGFMGTVGSIAGKFAGGGK